MDEQKPRRRKRGLEGFGFAIPEALAEAKQSMKRVTGNVVSLRNSPKEAADDPAKRPYEQSSSKDEGNTTQPLTQPLTQHVTTDGDIHSDTCGLGPKKINSMQDPAHDPAAANARDPASDPSVYPYTDKQKESLLFLYLKPVKITSTAEIASAIGISRETVRNIIPVLKKEGIIFNVVRYVKGRYQGFEYKVNESLCREILDLAVDPARQLTQRLTQTLTGQLPGQLTPRINDIYKRSDDDDSMHTENHHLSDDEIAARHKNLYEAGFRSKHFRQVIKAWKDAHLNLDELDDSLQKANWDVRENGDKMEKPCIYVLTALQNGPYTAPKGFKSKRRLQAEASLKESEKLLEIVQKDKENRFAAWWAELSPSEQATVDAEIEKTPEGRALVGKRSDSPLRDGPRMNHFLEKIYKKTPPG
ncbi:MAG: hypothetical protein M1398_03170 [Deltaproteobacteria bacterium]|nr:hypothetical protein [Deltaproteobacteria bacterium]